MIDRIADVAWLDATELMVLGAAAGHHPVRAIPGGGGRIADHPRG